MKERCDREPLGEGVAALTSDERTRWAKVGEWFLWKRAFKWIVVSFLEKSYMLTCFYSSVSFVYILTGKRTSNKHRSSQWKHPGDHSEQPVCYFTGWVKTLFHPRELHKCKNLDYLNPALTRMTFRFDSVNLTLLQMTVEALAGNPMIRWGDKSYNSIVFSDGTFGSTCDVSFGCPASGIKTVLAAMFCSQNECKKCCEYLFCSMLHTMPWCSCLCAGILIRKSRLQKANGR